MSKDFHGIITPVITVEERKKAARVVVEEQGSDRVIIHVGAVNTL